MFQKIPVTIGQYRPLSSFMHAIDTRAKVLPILLLLILLLFTDSLMFSGAMLFLIVVFLFYSGVDEDIAKKNLKPLLFFILFTSGYHLLFSGKDSEILFTFFNISLYKGAVTAAFYYSLRLVLFLSAAFFITLTCSPSEIAEAATKLLRPLKVFKFPLSDFSLILFISLRFIPILYEEFNNIKNAQRIRGVKFSGSLIAKILSLKSLIIPLFLSAVRRADDLSDALMVRGYNSHKTRTIYSTHQLNFLDISFFTLTVSCITVLYYFIG